MWSAAGSRTADLEFAPVLILSSALHHHHQFIRKHKQHNEISSIEMCYVRTMCSVDRIAEMALTTALKESNKVI